MTKEERQLAVESFLREEGYAPQRDSDGDVAFKYEGRAYVVVVDEADPMFFRLIFPNFWSIDSEEERAQVAEAALEACRSTKVAKVFPVSDNTWASVELFVEPYDNYRAVFFRSLGALQAATQTFLTTMRR